MSRKEEILKKHHPQAVENSYFRTMYEPQVKDAMDEHAKEQIIAFETWRTKTGYELHPNGFYSKEHPTPGVQTWFTLNEIYIQFVANQYIQSLTK